MNVKNNLEKILKFKHGHHYFHRNRVIFTWKLFLLLRTANSHKLPSNVKSQPYSDED